MERKLRRFAHGPDKNQERHRRGPAHLNSGQDRERDRPVRGLGKEFMEFDRAIQRMREDNPGKERHVADAQERKGSECSLQRGEVSKVVSEQGEQVAQELPTHKEHDKIGACHHAEKNERGDGNERQVAAIAAILVHIIHRIAIDDGADCRNQHHHHCAEPIDVEAQRQRQICDGRQIIEPDAEGALRRDRHQGDEGTDERRRQRQHAELRPFVPSLGLTDQDDDRCQ